jgi:uncharacterized membrane protein
MSTLYVTIFWLLHPFCHQQSDRSFHTLGLQWLLCARCSGAVIGALLAVPLLVYCAICATSSRRPLALLSLTLPLLTDGVTRFSNSFGQDAGNFVRFLTGLLFTSGCLVAFPSFSRSIDSYFGRMEKALRRIVRRGKMARSSEN